PPNTLLMVMAPSSVWLQDASVTVYCTVRLLPSTTKLPKVAVWLAASVTVTLYEPGAKPVKSSVKAPLLHKYEKGAVPPVMVKSIVPSLEPVQVTLVGAADNSKTPLVVLHESKMQVELLP